MNSLEAALNSVFARCVFVHLFSAVVLLVAPFCALLLLCVTRFNPQAAIRVDAVMRFVWDQSWRELVKFYSSKRSGAITTSSPRTPELPSDPRTPASALHTRCS